MTSENYDGGSGNPDEQLDERENADAGEWHVMMKAPVLQFAPAPFGDPITCELLRALCRPPQKKNGPRG